MIRTLVILFCGVTMALAAYAGQAGYPEKVVPETDRIREIRLREVDGFMLSYRIMPAEDGSAEEAADQAPKLLLLLEDPAGEQVTKGRVRFVIEAPRGRHIQVLAQPGRGGFIADLGLSEPGEYQVRAEVATESQSLEDSFLCRLN